MDSARMKVETIEVDPRTLSTRREISTDTKQAETPAKALQVGKLRASESVSPVARGIAEIYIKASEAALDNSRTRSGWTKLADNLDRQAKRANDDEFVVPFIQYDDSGELKPENAAEIVKLEVNAGDFVTVPLMTEIVNETDDGDGLSNDHVATIIENTKVFLESVEDLQIKKPVVGVIPPVSRECTDALLELYLEHDVQVYCVDFNRRSPMANAQLDHVVTPLMRTLERYDAREDSVVYAVNADEGRKVSDSRKSPGALYAYTLGFDIVGDKHIPPNLPESVLEDMEETTDLRLFDADSLSIVEVPLDELEDFLPAEAEIPVDRVRSRVRSSNQERFRYEKLINTELIELYLDEDDGVDVPELFEELRDGAYTPDADIDRIRNVVEEVSDDE